MNKNEFLKRIKSFADSHNMTAKVDTTPWNGEWGIEVGYSFTDGYEIRSRMESYSVKKNEDGKYNFWRHTYHDGKHRFSGPGYPSYSVFPQTPIELEIICKRFLNELKESAYYYDPIPPRK